MPSGNFGNICAGHVARMMGLPIDRLVLATNENDVLDEFFRTGTYRVRAQRGDARDLEPVDGHQQGVSNFERFVFDLLRPRRRARVRAAVRPQASSATAASTLAAAEFAPHRATSASSAAAARTPTGWRRSATPGSDHGVMIDTHTADGLKVAREHRAPACR